MSLENRGARQCVEQHGWDRTHYASMNALRHGIVLSEICEKGY